MLSDYLESKHTEKDTCSKNESPIIDTLKGVLKTDEIDLIYNQLKLVEANSKRKTNLY